MFTKSSVCAVAAAATVLGTAARADAFIHLPENCSYVWNAVGTGCAREVAVGPNNVPWILGCPGGRSSAPGPAGLYYLSYDRPPNELISNPQWNFDNIYGINVFVNLNSVPTVSGADGLLYTETHSVGGGQEQPTGNWMATDTGEHLGQVVISAAYTHDTQVNSGEYGWPYQQANPSDPYDIVAVWGMGCGNVCAEGPYNPQSNHPNGNIFFADVQFFQNGGEFTSYTTGWTHPPGSAIAIALFTDLPSASTANDGANSLTNPNVSNATVQNPWVVTDQGTIWYWSPGAYQFIQAPVFPDGYQNVQWLTDHFALDVAGNVWEWTGPSTGGTSSGLWQPVEGISPVAPDYNYDGNEPVIVQIAYSQAASGSFVGQSSNVGPSSLWGIDSIGNIYSAEYRCVIQ